MIQLICNHLCIERRFSLHWVVLRRHLVIYQNALKHWTWDKYHTVISFNMGQISNCRPHGTYIYIYIYINSLSPIWVYFCMTETWEHISVHWQQGKYQIWANCFMCWMPAANPGPQSEATPPPTNVSSVKLWTDVLCIIIYINSSSPIWVSNPGHHWLVAYSAPDHYPN